MVMRWIYSALIEPNHLYGVAFWRTAGIMLDSLTVSEGPQIFTTPTKVLFAMLNWLPTEIFAKQMAKSTATRLNALSRWHIVTYGHSSFLEIDPVAYWISIISL